MSIEVIITDGCSSVMVVVVLSSLAVVVGM